MKIIQDLVATLREVFKDKGYLIGHYHYWRENEEGYIAVKEEANEFVIYVHYEVYERNTQLDAFSEDTINEKKEKYQGPSKIIVTFLKKNDYTILNKGLVETEISGNKEIGYYIIFGKEGKEYLINILDEIPT